MLYKNIIASLFIIFCCVTSAQAAENVDVSAEAISKLRAQIEGATNIQEDARSGSEVSVEMLKQAAKFVAPVINKQNAKTMIRWDESAPDVKVTECATRHKTCIDAALKGGHKNFIAEASRLHFCKTSKIMCGEYWK